jgi:adenylylsulfate kinase-like enzyme
MNPSETMPGPGLGHAIVMITGVQAAGKSTVAQALAERLPRSVHVRGDVSGAWSWAAGPR